MKSLVIAIGVILVAALAMPSRADERAAAVPQSSLESMGFASARLMADDEGLSVRGKGTDSASFWNGDLGKDRFWKHLNGKHHFDKHASGKHGHGKHGMARHDSGKRGHHDGFKHHFSQGKNSHRFFGAMAVHNFGHSGMGHQIR